MATRSHEWTEPRRTGNAHLLAGHIAGLISKHGNELNYAVDTSNGLGNPLTVFNVMTGNRYNVIVEQIEGVE